ncbi:MAG: 50S ribosomal protein L5 [Candidatus Pacearchaeota archaeon]|nr:50S ribosomal protein L5 [Candidatus Pacearchaeota archaeon]
MKTNPMREVKIEKVVLSVGGTAQNLERGQKLIERITERKARVCRSNKRIPSLGVRPGLEVGAMITLRGEKAIQLLRRLLASIDNQIKEKQISGESFSFGIKEYIEIPGMAYQRDLGMLGLEVSVSFCRAGKRVGRKKVKSGKIPKRQRVTKEEIIEYLNKLGIKVLAKIKEKRER